MIKVCDLYDKHHEHFTFLRSFEYETLEFCSNCSLFLVSSIFSCPFCYATTLDYVENTY